MSQQNAELTRRIYRPNVVSFRERRAVSVQVYRDRSDALEARGLSA